MDYSADEIAGLLVKAQQGESQAQYELGQAFFSADGVDYDSLQAFTWLVAAARQGHKEALIRVCEYGALNRFFHDNYAELRDLFEKTGADGYGWAYYVLGKLDYRGSGGVRDYDAAYRYFVKGSELDDEQCQYVLHDDFDADGKPLLNMDELAAKAESNDAAAQYKLAYLYITDVYEVMTDYSKSLWWFSRAAENGHPDAQYILGRVLYEELDARYRNVGNIFTYTALDEHLYRFKMDYKPDLPMAFHWFKAAAEQGHPEAQLYLARIYEFGFAGMEPDHLLAVKWYTAAAESGEQEAIYPLAMLYMNPDSPAQDYVKAYQWHYKNSEVPDWYSSKVQLGNLCARGLGVKRDYKEAARWYQLALDKDSDDAEAAYRLAELYFDGKGVKRDYDEAFKFYERAAYKNYAAAKLALAQMYAQGKGVERDRVEAYIRLYALALEDGDEYVKAEAQKMLADLAKKMKDKEKTAVEDKLGVELFGK